jgi:stage II sporulation protein P
MFNVAIINKKDLIKYLVRITVILIIVVGLARYFSNAREETEAVGIALSEKVKNINSNIYFSCLNKTIPAIEEVNKEIIQTEQEDEISEENIIERILEAELIMPSVDEESANNEEVAKEDTSNNEESSQDNSVTTEVVTQNPIASNPTDTYGSVQIKNETSYELTEDMLTPNIDIQNKNVVIFHTHTCESYTPSEGYEYEATGTYRTTDLNYSVARVGDEFANYLTNFGFNVVHDKTYHDYPAYTGSYTRSLKTVQSLLQSTSADIVVDLHRDAIGSKSDYAPTVKIGDDYAAQIMFVVGTDGGGLFHPNWNQNLKFAVKIQEKAEELYPGLFKPIILRNSRYNQHLTSAATIIEVGATGNTMEQCLNSMKYLSEVFNQALNL